MSSRTRHAARTHVGRVRSQNEDAHLENPDTGLYLVADGMGGHAAGEVASGIAADTLGSRLDSLPPDADSAADELSEAIREANSRILREAAEDPAREGMGTTVTALLTLRDGRSVVGHVGDSRAYRLRDGEFLRITRDHTWVQEQVERGGLTPEAARLHSASGVLTRALGVEADVEPDLIREEWREGDLYLLCSDGLTGMVPDRRIAELLRNGEDLEERADALVELANREGGRDNVTVVLVAPGEG